MIDYVSELNDEQLAVVSGGDGPCLVLAGAGTGKTRTITYRVAWLLQHGLNPQNLLLVTFTNKASKEMIHRVEGLLGSYPTGLYAGTFHSIANRLLRQYSSRLGFGANFSILSVEDAEDLLELCMHEARIDTKSKRFPRPSVLLGVISFARNRDQSLFDCLSDSYANFLPIAPDILRVAELYALRKKATNSMDFDDLLIQLRDLLANDHELRRHLSDQFKYVMVDEFQDTNAIQAQLVRFLSAQHGNLLVVGDDAQSIYSFRAADISQILNFPDTYKETKVFKLTRNYRSSPEILAIANETIAANTEQFSKELRAQEPSGALPIVAALANPNAEASYVADRIEQDLISGVEPNQIAVLFRAAHHSQSLEFELMKRHIAYDYRGGLRFFERAHIKDAIAFTRIFENKMDSMALIRILRLYPGIGLVTAGAVAAKVAAVESWPEILEAEDLVPARARAGWEKCRQLLARMYAVRQAPASLIRTLAGDDDYRAHLEAEYGNSQERLDDLEEFSLFAEQFLAISEFLEMVSLTDEGWAKKNNKNSTNSIILSTIHQAKGLEWHSVYILHVCEGNFPGRRSYGSSADMAEERRLFYVAVTRAKRSLTISYPQVVGYEHAELRAPSVFIEDLSPKLYEEVRIDRSWGDTYRSSIGPSSDNWSEPTIVLDDLGETRPTKTAPLSFLRDLDDL